MKNLTRAIQIPLIACFAIASGVMVVFFLLIDLTFRPPNKRLKEQIKEIFK
jgi:hypothetical protein